MKVTQTISLFLSYNYSVIQRYTITVFPYHNPDVPNIGCLYMLYFIVLAEYIHLFL
jgi:hypothetical protein